ncbi:MAG TPA: hypothetical protein VFU15_03950 [Bacteroidia bacterium]|nr:hypothetical protein [Bacteroidia bacterium]
MKNPVTMDRFVFAGKHPAVFTGLVTAGGLIAYFLVMRAAGLVQVTELRLFNFVILFAGVWWSMKRETAGAEKDHSYFSTLGNGCAVVITAVAFFSLFILFYLNFDNEAMEQIREHAAAGRILTPEMAAIAVFAEGLSSGIVMAYVFLSYLRLKQN